MTTPHRITVGEELRTAAELATLRSGGGGSGPPLGGPNTWTGTQDFAGATTPGLARTSGGNTWTGAQNFTGATVTGIATASAWQFTPEAYGAKGDGVTDDTAAINAAVSAAVTYAQAHNLYAEVIFGAKTYLLSSPTTKNATYKGNAQIPLPIVPDTVAKVTLVFRGVRDATPLLHWNQTVPQVSGAVLRSTLTGLTSDATYGEPSVIGGPTPQQGYGTGLSGSGTTFSNMLVVIDGITVVNPVDPTICGMDFRGVAEANIPNASVMAYGTVAQLGAGATSTYQFGVAMPTDNNNDNCNIGWMSVEGQYLGYCLSEHMVAQSIRALYCAAGIACTGGSSAHARDTAHGSWITYASVEACQVAVAFYIASTYYPFKINIDLLDVETISSAVIYDPNNYGLGYIGCTKVGPNSMTLADVNGAYNLRVIDAHRTTGAQVAPALPATTVALQNPYLRDCAVTISGGTVAGIAVDGQALGVTSGTVFVPTMKTITLTYSVAPTWRWTAL